MSRRTVVLALAALALFAPGPRASVSGSEASVSGSGADEGGRAAPGPAPADSGRAGSRHGTFDASGWVMLRSGLIPGWGQAHNGRWLKALAVAGIEAALIERLVFEQGRVEYYQDRAAELPPEEEEKRAYYESKVDRHESHRRDFIWWTSLAVVLAMGDAYVDARLRDYDVELQAEPEPGAAGGAAGVRVRLSVSRRF
jgi:hypothetical protein